MSSISNLNSVTLLLGSNHRLHDLKLRQAIDAVQRLLASSRVSDLVVSRDAAGGTRRYLNAVIVGETAMSLDQLVSASKDIERYLGRRPESKAEGIVEMDIDVVVWNDCVLREDDASRGYFIDCVNTLKLP